VLRFFHLSDIHFVKDSGGPWDIDEELRHGLLKDAERLTGRCGPSNGVLLTGDIAFSGEAKEYENATHFLEALTSRIGCGPAEVWCVPGNHDVNRRVAGEPSVQSFHETIRRGGEAKCGSELSQLLKDQHGGSSLLRPMETYLTKFAANYGREVSAAQPWWDAQIPLGDNFHVHIRGMTSTLVSDQSDKKGNLVLGTNQAFVPDAPGKVVVVLSHHPPSWLMDDDGVQRSLRKYAHIQLFGHKHSQDVVPLDNSLVLCAGAVHPSRQEQGWQPRYNVLTIEAQRSEPESSVRIEVMVRCWDDSQKQFKAEVNEDDETLWVYDHIRIQTPPATEAATLSPTTDTGENTDQFQQVKSTPETRAMTPVRTLAYRFLRLDYYQQRSIIRELALATKEQESLPDSVLFKLAFATAREQSREAALWDAVEEAHEMKLDMRNPFRESADQ